MKLTLLDLRRDPEKILTALERNEPIVLSHRGKAIARIVPLEESDRCRPSEHEAFGMWADREDMKDPSAWVAELRKGRFRDR